MDRAELMQLINSGRSLAFNCHEIGRGIAPDDPVGKLFRNKALNNTLFFKTMERDATSAHAASKMRTLIYFPYNLDNVAEGGDSVLFEDSAFELALRQKTGADPTDEAGQVDYAMDLEILEMIYALPTFDPFLLKSKAQQLDLDGRIHDDYLNINEEEWNRIREPIRRKIRTLVRRACTGGSAVNDEAIERHVSLFLDKLWVARDIEGIEDFVASLEIDAERAPDLFFAWKAICFYQVEFEGALAEIKRFFKWLGSDTSAVPSDWIVLHPDEKTYVEYAVDALRSQVRATFLDIRHVLDTYEESYRRFIEESSPHDFKEFLSHADDHYINLAASLSANLHAVKIWESMVGKFGGQLKYDKFRGLIDTLSGLYDVRPQPIQKNRAAS